MRRDEQQTSKPSFGFVVFADPSVLDIVLQEKHTIDGLTVKIQKNNEVRLKIIGTRVDATEIVSHQPYPFIILYSSVTIADSLKSTIMICSCWFSVSFARYCMCSSFFLRSVSLDVICGSETVIDKSKSIKTLLMKIFKDL